MSSASVNLLPPESSRFSIRLPRPLWLGVVTVVLVVVATGLQIGVPSYRHHVAIREIERRGGEVRTRKSGLDWLRPWVGDDRMRAFESVEAVQLNGPHVTDADLEHIKWLTSLEGVVLRGTRVTDTGLEHLVGLRNLRNVVLDGAPVTDKGLEFVRGLPKLQILSLAEAPVTDAGLAQLVSLTSLSTSTLMVRPSLTQA
jgi:hypothetical protein